MWTQSLILAYTVHQRGFYNISADDKADNFCYYLLLKTFMIISLKQIIFFISGLDYLGSCLDIQCTDEHVSVTLTKQGPVKLNIFLYKSSKSELLSLGHVRKLPRQKFAVKSSSATHGSKFSTLMMGFAVFFTKTLVSILRSF